MADAKIILTADVTGYVSAMEVAIAAADRLAAARRAAGLEWPDVDEIRRTLIDCGVEDTSLDAAVAGVQKLLASTP